MTAPRRGEVFSCSLNPAHGAEQRGTRSVIVVSNDAFNQALPLVTVIPVTTFRRRSDRVYPSEALIPAGVANLRVNSLALCHQVRTVSRARLKRRIGTLSDEALGLIDDALLTHLGLPS